MWQQLIANFAIVGLFISLWAQLQDRLLGTPSLERNIIFGAVMGAGSVASIALAIQFQPGILFDLRCTLIAVAGFIGGPVAALVAGAVAIAYRLTLGGAGVWSGTVGILLTMAIGTAFYLARRKQLPGMGLSLLFAGAASIVPFIGLATLADDVRLQAIANYGPALLGLSFLASLLAVILIVHARKREEASSLIAASLSQAPDYLYVKDRESRFVTANQAVASFHGFSNVGALSGLTDFELSPSERAKGLYDIEQQIMQTGQSVHDLEEMLIDAAGNLSWFSTSKVPLRNGDGKVIGLAGVTRDVTERKAMEKELLENRDLLDFVLKEMSDGLALFQHDGTLVFCNDQYRALFARTSDLRVPGANLADILREVYERGEQVDIDPDRVDEWIGMIMNSLKSGSDEEVHLFDGRWLHVRTKPVSGDRATVVVSDISTIKSAEREMYKLTEQLKLLARTDGLTGLLNRRAFDELLGSELNRTERTRAPLSLIMLDIDRFKAFNDHYGHPAGDACLQRVARTVQQQVRSPVDSVVRYGGEEICIVLPDTGEDGAYRLAERIRKSIRDLALEHQGSEKGIVTVSLGIASYAEAETARSALELVSRADEALYQAKDAGRDRVAGWSKRQKSRMPAA